MKLIFLIVLSLFCCVLSAQPGYKVNEETVDFNITKILNYSSTSGSLRQFQERLLIIDFFGTWCAPCVNALPQLAGLQKSYKDQITILLVSEEKQDKLERFISKRDPFIFPIVVDEQKKFINLFQPPSYPYTVVIGKNNKVLAIPKQEDLTEVNINIWLKEQDAGNSTAGNATGSTGNTGSLSVEKKTISMDQSQNNMVRLSQDFIYAAKTGEETSGFINQLQQLSIDNLQSILPSDNEKMAFWINLYNAYTQVALKADAAQYKKRSKFFGSKKIQIAGNNFSLDDIEHGILRRTKIKWSLGYLNSLFPGKIEKSLRVKKLDYRIHFALNCGARSCPPIAFYKSESINQQLDIAMKAYLQTEVVYDEKSNIVELPAIMSWFRRDFGGKKKMLQLLQQMAIIPEGRNPKIKFKKYDWALYLQNYKS